LLLGVLDKSSLTLGDNQHVDLSRTIIVMTSNLGSSEMSRLASGGIGFAPKTASAEDFDQKIYRVAVDAAKRRFSPEFMNRIDKVVVFRTLSREQLRQILDIELDNVQTRITSSQAGRVFELQYTSAAKDFLLKEGTDLHYGARHLKRAIERLVVFPLSSLMASGQIQAGDTVQADVANDGTGLTFVGRHREPSIPTVAGAGVTGTSPGFLPSGGAMSGYGISMGRAAR
jgi:ATP-dependent Clp protease ATP-binding subunit ClpA